MVTASSMVYSITGPCIAKNEDAVVISIAGIGIAVQVLKDKAQRTKIGEETSLFTWLYPQTIQLFGFEHEEEMRLFELLNLVSGIGPRGALKILNSASIQDIHAAIMCREPKSLSAVCGITEKVASKIIIELNERLKKEGIVVSGVPRASKEVEQVLARLGYARSDIKTAIEHIHKDTHTIEEQVKQALRALAGK